MHDDHEQAIQTESETHNSKKIYKILKIIVPSFLIIIPLIIITFSIVHFINEKNRVENNTKIKINNKTYSLENFTYNKTILYLNNLSQKYTSQKIYLTVKNKSEQFKLCDIGITVNENIILEKIKKSRYSKNYFDYINQKISNKSVTINLSTYLILDEKKFSEFFSKNFTKYNISVKNSELKIVNDKLLITHSANGQTINKTEFEKLIIANIKANKLELKVPIKTLLPSTTSEDFKNVLPTYVLSSFSTDYSSSSFNRKINVNLAASKLNNILLKPNETFEFYKYVGEPTIYRGFRTAPIYLNGAVSQGVGGGMCQVSTTLYNAALLADLKIVERSNHILPVHYIPLGLDATVSYGLYTLKFKNNTNGYLRIKSYYNNSTLNFTIYGSCKPQYKVCVYSVQRAYNSAEAYRDLYKNGKKAKSEFLGISTYK